MRAVSGYKRSWSRFKGVRFFLVGIFLDGGKPEVDGLDGGRAVGRGRFIWVSEAERKISESVRVPG